ncbi:hypothetical protein EMMF5_002768 [Cystobasidiomycetes sp. EMM_F5]
MYGEAQSRPYATGEALPEHTPAVQSSSTSNFAAGMSSEGVASNGWSAYGHPDWQQSQQLPYDQQPGRTTDINPMDILQQFAFTNRIEAANAEDDIQSGTLFPGVTKFKAAVQRYIDAACPSTILCKDSHCAGWILSVPAGQITASKYKNPHYPTTSNTGRAKIHKIRCRTRYPNAAQDVSRGARHKSKKASGKEEKNAKLQATKSPSVIEIDDDSIREASPTDEESSSGRDSDGYLVSKPVEQKKRATYKGKQKQVIEIDDEVSVMATCLFGEDYVERRRSLFSRDISRPPDSTASPAPWSVPSLTRSSLSPFSHVGSNVPEVEVFSASDWYSHQRLPQWAYEVLEPLGYTSFRDLANKDIRSYELKDLVEYMTTEPDSDEFDDERLDVVESFAELREPVPIKTHIAVTDNLCIDILDRVRDAIADEARGGLLNIRSSPMLAEELSAEQEEHNTQKAEIPRLKEELTEEQDFVQSHRTYTPEILDVRIGSPQKSIAPEQDLAFVGVFT